MVLIVCVSDGGGMTFGGRRVSKDAAVISDISRLVGDGVLYIGEYSESQFSDSEISVIAASEPLESAGEGEHVFIENMPVRAYKDRLESVIIYRWNRKYPFDFKLDIEPEKEGMTLVGSLDLKGRSHDKITREIWKK